MRPSPWQRIGALDASDRVTPVTARRRSRPARPITFTGEHFRNYRGTLLAQLHGAARARGVELADLARHSRLAKMLAL